MSIIDEYISQHHSARLSLDVTEEDITWQLRGSHSDHVIPEYYLPGKN